MSEVSLLMPPRLYTTSGEERRVGVELEMSGLDLDRLAHLVARVLGLQLEHSSRYERRITGDSAGDWRVELDFNLLKQLGRETRVDHTLLGDLETAAEEVLARGASQLVPIEIISPPLPLTRLHELETLIQALRTGGALGTSGKLRYAFGMHFNPDVPDRDSSSICDYLRAFHCLYDWLEDRAAINFTRRLTSYIDPFPRHYVTRMMAWSYRPALDVLIDDYLRDNPTRNRAMDMLPLFTFLDETRVRRVCDDVLIKSRPTFHYRLPNCEIDQPGWGLQQAWNDWVQVERLAEDKARLQRCCDAYLEHLHSTFHLPGAWLRQINLHWLDS